MVDEIDLNALRYERLNKCFSIINRGELWYDNWTPQQLEELKDWYNTEKTRMVRIKEVENGIYKTCHI